MNTSRHLLPLSPSGRGRAVALSLLAILAAPSCAPEQDPGPAPSPEQPAPGGEETPAPPQDDLKSLSWSPTFEPDYNNLAPYPWVMPTTKEQQDSADVLDDRLVFPKDGNPEVGDWQPGRIVVSAPGEGAGRNPLGFARRVRSVSEQDGKWIVQTENVALEDLFEGDFQLRFDPGAVKEVDLSKLDLQWAADNLYVDTAGKDLQAPVQTLVVNADEELDLGAGAIGDGALLQSLSGDLRGRLRPFSLGGLLSGAGKALANVAKDVFVKVTPSSFEGSISLTKEINQSVKFPLFANLLYAKNITKGRFPMRFFIKGGADFGGSIILKPGFQVGARIPNTAHDKPPPTKVWVNIDSFSEVKLDLNFDIDAGIESADGTAGSLLQQKLEADATMASELYAREKEILFGDPDMRVPGNWKKNLWISRPTTQTFFAGAIPVVLVETMQVDLECGFEAKASLKGKFHYEKSHSFKFKLEAEAGKDPIIEPPRYEKRTVKTAQLTGGGELTLACGLIPRVNIMVYDAVGLNAGFRGSLVAKASYDSKCTRPTSTKPSAEATIGLYGNVGVQAGARVQVPGSSYAGKGGLESGRDIGPIELWNTQFPLWENTWKLDGGFGYCTPLCKDGKKDLLETDIDCGGGDCGTCAAGKRCAKNTDCVGPNTCNRSGVCAVDYCNDRVVSGDETDVDCGGKCGKCAVSKGCRADADCASSACLRSGSSGRCVPSTCVNGRQDGGETGRDCGGPCGKCKTGVACSNASDCESGFSNGLFCVKDACWDARKSAGESDVDCGGASACNRCGLGRACAAGGDCQGGLTCERGACVPILTAMCRDGVKDGAESDVDCGGLCASRCARDKACRVPNDCASLSCVKGACGEPLFCMDKRRDGNEGDVDCGGACDAKCQTQQGCVFPSDCQSGVCKARACAAPSCADGVKNGAESDVDCGTGECGLCGVARSCVVDGNCASGTCLGKTCVAAEPQAASPGAGAIEIDLAQAVEVRFYRDLDATTVNGTTVTATAMGSLPGTVSYADRVLRFTPTGGWPAGATVTVSLGTGITDKNGRAVFAAPYEVSFQTLSPAALISQWKFDGDGADASGNGHVVTLSPGGASWAASAYQGTGSLRLDGVSGYGNVGAIDVGDEFSIAGWFNLDAPLRSNIHTIVSTGLGGIEKSGFKVFINSFGTADASVIFETGTGTDGVLLQSPTGFVSAGKWQHFAITVNRVAGTAAMYWNGVQATTSQICVKLGVGVVPCAPGVQAQPGFTGTNAMSIGMFPGPAFPLQGNIDDLRIYKRILTPQEVAKIAAQK